LAVDIIISVMHGHTNIKFKWADILLYVLGYPGLNSRFIAAIVNEISLVFFCQPY